MAANVYTGVIRMGDGRYYSRSAFDVDAMVSNGNATDEADAETKIIAHFQDFADLSGGVLLAVTKSIFYDGAVVVPDADPDFEYEEKILCSTDNGNTAQIRVPAVEPNSDVQTWFTNATHLIDPLGYALTKFGEAISHRQKAPRVSI
jgi:hypothetical protein